MTGRLARSLCILSLGLIAVDRGIGFTSARLRPCQPKTLCHQGSDTSNAAPSREELDSLAEQVDIDGRTSPHGAVDLFPSLVYKKSLSTDEEMINELNTEIMNEAKRLMETDKAGKTWCETNYEGGYTSFGSERALHQKSEPFSYLEGLLQIHLRKFTSQLRLEEAGALQLTDCWVNVMGKGTTHVLHHHGNAIISGTYYVRTPQGCPGITFEDPRLDRMKHKALRGLVEMPVESGDVVLFESWMRHKVSPNMVDEKRVSVSFNYCLPATRIPRAKSADRGVLL